MFPKRGEIYYVNLDPTKGSEQAGRRPVLILQNDIGNQSSPTTIAAPLTTKSFSKIYPINVAIPKGVAGLKENSTVILSQVRVIDKKRLESKVGNLSSEYMKKVNKAIHISLELD